MKMAQDAEYQQEENYDNHISEDVNMADSSLNYAELLAQNNLYRKFDPDLEPTTRMVSHGLIKHIDPEIQDEKELLINSFDAKNHRPRDDPCWILITVNSINLIRNSPEWTRRLADSLKKLKLSIIERRILKSANDCRTSTVLSAGGLVCPLITKSICLEDVMPDIDCQFNIIPLKVLWTFRSRFPSWEKTFEIAITLCNKEKVIQASDGQEIPAFAVIKLYFRFPSGKKVSIYWTIYEDLESTRVLNTKGSRTLEMEPHKIKSSNLGNIKLLVPKDEVILTLNMVYNAAFYMLKIDKTLKTPLVVMKSYKSIDLLMVVIPINQPPLLEADMAHLGLNQY
jgi:hypothetical protein